MTIFSNVNTIILKINKQGLPSFQILAQALPVFSTWSAFGLATMRARKAPPKIDSHPLTAFPRPHFWLQRRPRSMQAGGSDGYTIRSTFFFSNLGCNTIPFTLLLGADPVPRLWQAGSILRKRGQKFKLGKVANVLKCHFIVQTPLSTFSVGQLAQIGKHENYFTPICRVDGHSKLMLCHCYWIPNKNASIRLFNQVQFDC